MSARRPARIDRELLDHNIVLYRHRQGLLHSKTMTVDDSLALVGSGNFDIRSFAINFELSLLSYGSQATAALRFLQQEYIEQSEELTAKAWSAERGRCGHLFDDTAKLFSPLL